MELTVYAPAGFAILCATGFALVFTAVAMLVGPTRRLKERKIKYEPFECGMDPIGSPRGRYSVKFYQVAILFLVFDIEAAFMYPWAVEYRNLSQAVSATGQPILTPEGAPMLSAFGFAEMMLFVGVLIVALAYVWRKRAIGWD